MGFVALFVLSTTPVTTKSQQRLPIAPIRSLSPPNSSASFLLVRLRTRQADIIRLRVRVLRHALDPGQQPSWANGDQIENNAHHGAPGHAGGCGNAVAEAALFGRDNAFAHRHQNQHFEQNAVPDAAVSSMSGKLERLLVATFGEAALNG